MADDYEATFGGGAARLTRGRILGALLGIPLEDMPRYRDAWCERWQNPDREPGGGHRRARVHSPLQPLLP